MLHYIRLIELIFTKNALRFNLRANNMQNFQLKLGYTINSVAKIDFSVVTPYIPDSPPKEKS